MDKENSNSKLKDALHFTEKDLRMNEKGKVSEAQATLLKENRSFTEGNNLILLVIAGPVLVLVPFGIMIDYFSIPTLLLFFGGASLFWHIFNIGHYKRFKDLREGKTKVEALEGKVTQSMDKAFLDALRRLNHGKYRSSGKVMKAGGYLDYIYILEIGGKKIKTTKAIQECFEDGKAYRIYFVRTSTTEVDNILYGSTIISAVPIA